MKPKQLCRSHRDLICSRHTCCIACASLLRYEAQGSCRGLSLARLSLSTLDVHRSHAWTFGASPALAALQCHPTNAHLVCSAPARPPRVFSISSLKFRVFGGLWTSLKPILEVSGARGALGFAQSCKNNSSIWTSFHLHCVLYPHSEKVIRSGFHNFIPLLKNKQQQQNRFIYIYNHSEKQNFIAKSKHCQKKISRNT